VEKEEFSWLFKSKFFFSRISQPKWALSLKWMFTSCFKPILVLKLS
jgi:hypothetical protein